MKRPNRSAAQAIADLPPAQPEPGDSVVSTPEDLPTPPTFALVEPERADVPTLAISEIVRDAELNFRAGGVNEKLAAQYAGLLKEGRTFDPVIIFRDPDGMNWLADGWHRVRAHELAERADIAIDLREGTRRDAMLYAAGANARHGARLTNACKRKAVTALLADPEWSKEIDEWIGEKCGTSREFVNRLRAKLASVIGSQNERVTRNGKLRKTPKAKAKAVKPPKVDRVVRAAEKGFDSVVKAWPKGFDPAPLLAAAKAWVQKLETSFIHQPTPTGRPTEMVNEAAE
jgi:hypothetical protein